MSKLWPPTSSVPLASISAMSFSSQGWDCSVPLTATCITHAYYPRPPGGGSRCGPARQVGADRPVGQVDAPERVGARGVEPDLSPSGLVSPLPAPEVDRPGVHDILAVDDDHPLVHGDGR